MKIEVVKTLEEFMGLLTGLCTVDGKECIVHWYDQDDKGNIWIIAFNPDLDKFMFGDMTFFNLIDTGTTYLYNDGNFKVKEVSLKDLPDQKSDFKYINDRIEVVV